jgi:hypothetical protein
VGVELLAVTVSGDLKNVRVVSGMED